MFSKRLSALRKRDKLTQEELCKKLGINRATYSNYEAGRREPDIETIRKIADFFDVSTDYLLGETDDPMSDLKVEEIKKLYDPDDPYWQKAIELYKEVQQGKRPVIRGLDVLSLLALPIEEQKRIIRQLRRIIDSVDEESAPSGDDESATLESTLLPGRVSSKQYSK